jgi:hypothetical protein
VVIPPSGPTLHPIARVVGLVLLILLVIGGLAVIEWRRKRKE